jgi:hypothetical protein
MSSRATIAEPTGLAHGEDLTAMTTDRTLVLFIHGLWLHATSWAPWVGLFRDVGYEPMAAGWPGDPGTVEAGRPDPR